MKCTMCCPEQLMDCMKVSGFGKPCKVETLQKWRIFSGLIALVRHLHNSAWFSLFSCYVMFCHQVGFCAWHPCGDTFGMIALRVPKLWQHNKQY